MARVLIVDDALFMRMLLKNIIEKSGNTVVAEACNGEEAISMYAEYHPDLVCMDITMPGTSGLEALRVIKENDPDATVIMCSSMGQSAMVLEAIKLGAKDFIVKPFQPLEMAEIINKVLHSKETYE